MAIADDTVHTRAYGWRTLAALHAMIDSALERALRAEHHLSVVEYTVLDVLSRQQGWHLRIQQVARATALSPSATTRLVSRLEDRGWISRVICAQDRRGIYTELSARGDAVLVQARPTYDTTLREALAEAATVPELAELVDTVHRLPTAPTP